MLRNGTRTHGGILSNGRLHCLLLVTPGVRRRCIIGVLNEIPAKVLEVTQETLSEFEFKQALRAPGDRYEVSGKDKSGNVHTIKLTTSGDILEVERCIRPSFDDDVGDNYFRRVARKD
jgi:hypothetical protein